MASKPEQEKRLGIASELADLEVRQRLILQWDLQLSAFIPATEGKVWQTILDEDQKTLRMLETVMTSFGVRVEPKTLIPGLIQSVAERVDDPEASLREKLAAYALAKQTQLMCGHLVLKCVQRAMPDVREALSPLKGVQVEMEKQYAQIIRLFEKVGVESIMDAEPALGVAGRLRDALATVGGAVLAKTGQPADATSILNVLRADHAKVRTLFQEIDQATEASQRRDLFLQLRSDLLSHAEAEEQTVYRYYQRYDDLHSFFDDSFAEHEELRGALDRVSFAPPMSAAFQAEIMALRHLVDQHVAREEDAAFRWIANRTSHEELAHLAAAFIQVKAGIQEQLSPDSISGFAGPAHDSESQALLD